MNQLFAVVKNLNPNEIQVLQQEFVSIFISREKQDELFDMLHPVVSRFSIEEDFLYRNTYARWYVELFWRRLRIFSLEQIIQIGVARHVPLAIALGFDVWQELAVFLATQTNGIDDLEDVFTTMQEAFLMSSAILGQEGGEKIAVKNLAKDFKIFSTSPDRTLKFAEFIPRIENLLYTSSGLCAQKNYFSTDQEWVSDKLAELISFYTEIEKNKIFYIVNQYTSGSSYSQPSILSGSFAKEKNFKKEDISLPQTIKEKNIPVTASQNSKHDELQVFQKPVVAQPSYQDIKKMVDAVFPQSSEPDFKGIVAMLNTLSEKYDDEKIRDLYFYNEQVGKFQWSDSLSN